VEIRKEYETWELKYGGGGGGGWHCFIRGNKTGRKWKERKKKGWEEGGEGRSSVDDGVVLLSWVGLREWW